MFFLKLYTRHLSPLEHIISRQKRYLSVHFNSALRKDILPLKATHIHRPYFQLFCRNEFSGRKGGLKRKKPNKLDVRIQTSLGRRIEFYHPPKKKRVRIRLIQNSRGNLVYDSVIKRFLVVYYKQGIQVFRPFSSRNGKFEYARTKSIALTRQLAQKYQRHSTVEQGSAKDEINFDERIQPDVSASGVGGVFFDPDEKSWVVHFNEAGTRKYRKFNIDILGFQNAYTSAIAFKRFKLMQYHQFLPIRHRHRRGRRHLR